MASSVMYQRKRALIIGINKYPRDPLKYCINDAKDLNIALQRIGFDVLPGENCNLREFYDIVDIFAATIEHGDLVLFYFAGHGKQNEDDNYLLPSDYDYNYRGHERDYIVNHAINVNYIMKKIDDTQCRITTYIFDCCRILVKTRSTNMNLGLLPIIPPLQTLVVFSCAPGKAVLEETGNDRNGSFIESLLKYIRVPGTDIEEVIRNVACDVSRDTRGFQVPYRTSCLTDKVYLRTNNDEEMNRYQNIQLQQTIKEYETERPYARLGCQELNDQDMNIVVKEAIISKRCIILDLRSNIITSVGASIIAEALSNNKTLQELILYDNEVSDQGVYFLVKELSNNNNILTLLNLGKNRITDESAAYLAKMIKTNKILKELWLHDNKISDDGIQILANAIRSHNTTIKFVNLSFNRLLTDSSVDSLVQMIQNTSSLKHLYVEQCDLSERGKKDLLNARKLNINIHIWV